MYDCQTCGACCIDYFGTPGYIDLEGDEPRRMRRLGLPVIAWRGQALLGTRPHDGPGGGTCCVAFVGAVGADCACAIHPERPASCRRFAAGSDGCRFARAAAGLSL